MTSAEMMAIAKGLEHLFIAFNEIGIIGVLLVIWLAPMCIVMIILYMNHKHSVKMDKAQVEYREDISNIIEENRKNTDNILSQIGKRHDDLIRLHQDTLLQLKTIDLVNEGMHTLIVNNTIAMEQLKAVIIGSRV